MTKPQYTHIPHNKGTVRLPVAERFWQHVNRGDGCWEWTAQHNRKGYGRFMAPLNRNHATVFAHRFAYELTYGPIPAGMWVLHRCDNPACVRPEHLYLGDKWQNARDAVERNRVARGERNGAARLTDEAVRRIFQLASEGLSQRQIAARVGCAQSTVGSVLRREYWSHVV